MFSIIQLQFTKVTAVINRIWLHFLEIFSIIQFIIIDKLFSKCLKISDFISFILKMYQCFVLTFILFSVLNCSTAKNIPKSHVKPPKNAKIRFGLSLVEQQEIGILQIND